VFVYFIYLTLQSIAGRRVYAGILFDTPLWTGSGDVFHGCVVSLSLVVGYTVLMISRWWIKVRKRSNQQKENFPEAIVSKNQSRV